MVTLPEFLQIYPLIPFHGDQVIVPLFIVPDKQVLGVRLRVGDGDLGKPGHIINRGMLRDLVPNFPGF